MSGNGGRADAGRLYGDRLKIMPGKEYSTTKDDAEDGGHLDGWTGFISGTIGHRIGLDKFHRQMEAAHDLAVSVRRFGPTLIPGHHNGTHPDRQGLPQGSGP